MERGCLRKHNLRGRPEAFAFSKEAQSCQSTAVPEMFKQFESEASVCSLKALPVQKASSLAATAFMGLLPLYLVSAPIATALLVEIRVSQLQLGKRHSGSIDLKSTSVCDGAASTCFRTTVNPCEKLLHLYYKLSSKSYKQFLWLYSTHKYSIMALLTRRRIWPTNKHSLPGFSLTQETLIFEDSVVTN